MRPVALGFVDDLRTVAEGWRWGHRPLPPRSAEALRPSPEGREFPTDWARSPTARAAREALLRFLFRPLVWSQTHPTVEGLDHLDAVQPPVVFVANHASHLDTPLILCALPARWRERTAVAAAADYFFDVWWRAAGTALAFNAFPVERTGGGRGTGTARRLLEEGWSLLVYPEGTRSRDGWLGRWRHGAARLCLEQQVAAVPVALRGTFGAMPRGRAWPRPGRPPVSVRFGRPLVPEPGEEVRALSRRMQHALARLWDEDATTWWASLRREAEGRTPSLAGPEGARWRRIWEATRPLPPSRADRVWDRGRR